jgi:hypothetical protein
MRIDQRFSDLLSMKLLYWVRTGGGEPEFHTEGRKKGQAPVHGVKEFGKWMKDGRKE